MASDRDLIARMSDWLATNRQDYFAQLQHGVSDDTLDAFEERFTLKLPSTFRSLYLWRNGQSSACSASFQVNRMFSSLEDITDTKVELDGMIGCDFDEPSWWRKEWVPFLANGGGDHLCLDLGAVDGGTIGQLIAFWHDWEDRSIEHSSVDEWLRHLVESMESGSLNLI